MKIFENKFYKSMISNTDLLNNIIFYIVKKKGKQIRPMFVFLIAKMLGIICEKTYNMASLIELIHTGALIHDDVIDNSNIRRGIFSIQAIWKNKVAILVGDYLLSKSLLIATDNEYYDLLKIIANAIKNMSEGELLQIKKSQDLNINEKIYNEIIYRKTASLIAACCEGAARSVNVNNKIALEMNKFGKFIGMAFQIKDDLLDYEQSNILDKPIGIDIKQRKLTLPIIYTIHKSSNYEKKWILNIIKKHNQDKIKINKLIKHVKKTGGLDYAKNKMIIFKNKALKIINFYPNNHAKKSLKIMIKYIIERKK